MSSVGDCGWARTRLWGAGVFAKRTQSGPGPPASCETKPISTWRLPPAFARRTQMCAGFVGLVCKNEATRRLGLAVGGRFAKRTQLRYGTRCVVAILARDRWNDRLIGLVSSSQVASTLARGSGQHEVFGALSGSKLLILLQRDQSTPGVTVCRILRLQSFDDR